MRPKLRVTRIPHMNTIVIKQTEGGRFFMTAKDSIVIDVPGLASLLKFLLFSNMISHRVLEGILEEYHSYGSKLPKN